MSNSYHAFDVITPFHAISSLSYCLSQAAENDNVTLHLVPAMHGRYLLEEICFMTSSGVRVAMVHQVPSGSGYRVFECLLRRRWFAGSDAKAKLFLGHHTYFKPTVLQYLGETLSGRDITTFAFEEGIGSYHNLAQEREVAGREGKRFYFVKYLLKQLFASPVFLDQRWGLLGSGENEEICAWHRTAAAELASHFYTDESEETGTKPMHDECFLFFTSPLVHLRLLNTKENEDLVLRIKDFFSQRGKILHIKPHPLDQEVYEHLVEAPGCVVKSQAPAEVYLIQHRYAGVAAVNSGALLTASMMFDQLAINFHAWLPEPAKQKLALGPRLRILFERYTRDCEEIGNVDG